MIDESGSGEQSSDDLKEQVKSLEEKLAKQQKLTEQIRKDRKKKSMTVTTLLAVIFGAFAGAKAADNIYNAVNN